MNAPVHYEVVDGIAMVTIDNPPVNALSVAVQEGLRDAVRRAFLAADVKAVVLSGAGGSFAAGADLKHLQRMAREGRTGSLLPGLLAEIERGPKPVVAALHGRVLGGGMELALAAHYRIAAPGCLFGQPEVRLGLIPGAGGTQRLPRLAPLDRALAICAGGESITTDRATADGILDRVVGPDLRGDAMAFAREIAASPTIQRTCDRAVREPQGGTTGEALAEARSAASKRAHPSAPLAAVDAIERATSSSFTEGCAYERATFERLLVSDEAQAFIHLFLAERAVESGVSSTAAVRGPAIERAAVVGAGAMGRGIAMALAGAGLSVQLVDRNPTTVEQALTQIRASYDSATAKGLLSLGEARARLGRVTPQPDMAALVGVDLVVEAAFENLDVKRDIVQRLDGIVGPDAILATNTSYLDVDAIAAASGRPARVVGLHFFNPAHVMRLVEVVPGRVTTPDVLVSCRALVKRLGKLGVVAGNCPGFIGNRMLRMYRREAQFLLEEGASPSEVDGALEEWGMKMGPFKAQDLAGLDIAMASRSVFQLLDPVGVRQPRVFDELCARGRFGQKVGAGWYRYDGRTAQADDLVGSLIDAASKVAGLQRRTIQPDEIVGRVCAALADEAARILEEGWASRASDIDVVWVHGYGFPAFRGGPLRYADSIGLAKFRERLATWRTVAGDVTPIASLLDRLAADGTSFAGADERRGVFQES